MEKAGRELFVVGWAKGRGGIRFKGRLASALITEVCSHYRTEKPLGSHRLEARVYRGASVASYPRGRSAL